jgi:lipopolysaccharide export LptBFGC system permease protein LptF
MESFDFLHWVIVLAVLPFVWLLLPVGAAFVIGWRATRRSRRPGGFNHD